VAAPYPSEDAVYSAELAPAVRATGLALAASSVAFVEILLGETMEKVPQGVV
jgi:hypothetical protein